MKLSLEHLAAVQKVKASNKNSYQIVLELARLDRHHWIKVVIHPMNIFLKCCHTVLHWMQLEYIVLYTVPQTSPIPQHFPWPVPVLWSVSTAPWAVHGRAADVGNLADAVTVDDPIGWRIFVGHIKDCMRLLYCIVYSYCIVIGLCGKL